MCKCLLKNIIQASNDDWNIGIYNWKMEVKCSSVKTLDSIFASVTIHYHM